MPPTPIAFEYVNAHGEHSVVQLVGWVEEGAYLTGRNLVDGRVKTYRIDRIQRYLDGSDALLIKPRQEPPPRTAKALPVSRRPEICFTGFEQQRKDQLWSAAIDAGLRPVASVTVKLAFLVCGANAGPVKVRKARERGIYVLREDQALALFETGELPDSQIPIATERSSNRVVEDPDAVFSHWAYRIERHHWNMLGLIQSTRLVAGEIKAVWVISDAGFDFCEGDIAYRGHEFIQVSYVDGTGYVEVQAGNTNQSGRTGYRMHEEQLAFWLETGVQPGGITPVFKGTSQAGLLAWQIRD